MGEKGYMQGYRLLFLIVSIALFLSVGNPNSNISESAQEIVYEAETEDSWDKHSGQMIAVGALVIICITLSLVIAITRQRNVELLQEKNSQLRDAVELASYANQAKSEFLARMSHEIRTPMNAIVGITNIARNSVDDPEKMREALDKIETSSRVLLNIINDVLDMSAIESNKLKLADAEFRIAEILNGIESIYVAQCKNKGVEFILSSDLKIDRIKGDALRVNQILLNLVSNAYKFTARGGKIEVEVYQLGMHNGITNLRFVVSDTGEGMSEDMLERLFLPFEQGSEQTAQKHGGSGLGLCITKNLVDMMHGQITVESKLGVGTTFTVDLPFESVTEMEVTGDAFREELEVEIANMDFSGKKILLAEDNEINQEIAVELLRMVGLAVDCASNGREAVDKMLDSEPGTYGAILMDIQMPELNGYEATRAIRKSKHQQAAEIPIYAMTANAFTEDVTAALSAGMNGHIAKPIDTEVLYKTLWEALK